MLPIMPPAAQAVIRTIQAAGGRGYLVGGALRDLMRGRSPEDWDFAATLPPERLLSVFKGSRLIGGACGTVEAPMPGPGGSDLRCEITPCRAEAGYSDRRHPDEIIFVPDILADLARRDFTVNAMAWDAQVLFDPFGGQRDLQKKRLRCVGRPADRFAEDPLRVLRLFRLAAQLGFTAEWGTFCAANGAMGGLDSLPMERVLLELRRILLSDRPQVLGGVIVKGGLARYGFHFAPNLAALAEVPRHLLCRWWALIALCGANTAAVAGAFGFSRRLRDELAAYTRLYRAGPAADGVALKLKLSATRLDYAPIAATFAAVSPAFSAEPALFAGVCIAREPYRLPDLAVDGDMLRNEGIAGEDCGKVLGELLTAVIRNPALNKPQVLLGLARGLKQLL